VLITGFAERIAVSIATSWILISIALMAWGNTSMLTGPYGAPVKDLCLIECAITIWTFAPMIAPRVVASKPPGRFRNGPFL
jgi:hypothetical protein